MENETIPPKVEVISYCLREVVWSRAMATSVINRCSETSPQTKGGQRSRLQEWHIKHLLWKALWKMLNTI